MEAYVFKYKLERLGRRLWYWAKQILLIALLIAVLLLLWEWQDQTAEHLTPKQGTVVTIVDGDTLILNTGTARQTIRISGIDAPEYHQSCTDDKGQAWDCGKEARSVLDALIKSGGLTCQIAARDAYQRAISQCSVTGIADIGREMVRRGAAVSGAETSGSRYNDGGPYLREEAEAARAKRGIWRGSFDRPADWRVKHPRAPQEQNTPS